VQRALLMIAACLMAGAVVSACSTPQAQKAPAPTAAHTNIAPTTSTTSKPVVKQAVQHPTGVLVAWSKVSSLPIWSSPVAGSNGPNQDLANPNALGAPLVLLVNSIKQSWVQVYLPERPNESMGWTLQSDVSLVRDPEKIVVNLSQKRLELYKGSTVAYEANVAVGSPESPTPTGQFFVTEVLKVSGTGNPYGPYALGLSGFSNTYTSFEGGPGQIAIHGTNEPWVVGQYASHGCVRLDNADITELALQVQAGTPVEIAG
jgi:lipoprotein-anchoring transpeptidase ErfK/SrfK